MNRDAGPPSVVSADLAGKWLGSFQLVRLLGTGAMGAVYLAKDAILRRDVALKLIRRGDDHSDEDRRDRVREDVREQDLATRHSHRSRGQDEVVLLLREHRPT